MKIQPKIRQKIKMGSYLDDDDDADYNSEDLKHIITMISQITTFACVVIVMKMTMNLMMSFWELLKKSEILLSG